MGKVRTLSRRRVQSDASVDDSWQAPSLTPSERAYMIRKAKEASVALVDHAHTLDGPVQWHYTGKFHGIQMYRGEGSYDRAGTAGTEYLCGVTTMMGSIEEVAGYFDQQTTEQMIAKKAEDVLDCGVLYSLVRGDQSNPFYRVSAKYQLYEGPSAFSRERDYCFLECQNTFRHASGRKGWVLSMHSIKLPNCPELEGVVRGSMYQSGYVFVEAERSGYMDVMHSLQINFKSTSRLPHFMLNSALKRRILSVVTISREIQTTRMGRQTLLKKKQLMPKRSRALCVNCARKFSLFVRKTRCRVCGEVVCQPCAPQVMISTQRGPVKTRVCMKCYQLSSDDEYEPVEALPNSHHGGNLRRMQNETRYSDILQDHHDHPDMYHEEDDDSLEEDGDEDGLEEQSDYSVFAQSRFTDASRDSFPTSQFGASNFESHFEGSSQFDTNELDDSQYYDGGSSENSFVSGTSSSHWQGGNNAVSSMMGWNQASSVKPADGYIYDPQASMGSNFYGASNYGSDNGGSNYTHKEESDKRAGRYKAAAPIPEDEPSSHHGYKISPNASYNLNTDYKSTQGTNHTSAHVPNVKATQGAKYDLSYASQNSNISHASKTVSIQSLAKARSARYGIKSQFPPPPPPPPLFPPLEEREESEEDDSPLHLGALKSDKPQSLKDRKPKGIATRKIFTPPPPKEGRRETDQRSVKRDPKVARNMAFNAALANRDSRVSQTSSRNSSGFGSTRSSAILEQVRRNRGRTPESDRSSALLKSKEEEHLMRMREIERMQEVAKDKAARRSMASNGNRSSMQATRNGVYSQNGGSSTAAAKKRKEQPRRSSRRSTAGSSLDSPIGPPPGSPPGTPPSMRSRRLPSNASFNSRADRSLGGNHSRRTDASSDFGESRFLSNRSNAAFARSGARVSLAPSAQSEDLMFKTQRSGHRASKGSKRRMDGSQGSSKGTKYSLRGRQLDSSYASTTPEPRHPDDLAFDASQLSLDKTKFSSSIAILETPGESLDHVVMMERPSAERNSDDSLLSEDLLSQSSAGMTEHINSMRSRAAYKLPEEEDRQSHELRRRQEEHRKRMEELTKMTANHVVEENIRDSTSTLGGLHDSSISLTGYSGNHFGDSTISSISSASSVDIDDGEFDIESRPLGRTKRSGTIPFALDELEQVPDVEDNDELSEGPDDSDTSVCLSEEHAEHDYKSEQECGYRSSDESAQKSTQVSLPAYRFSEEYVENKHEHEPIHALYRPSEEFVQSEHEHTSGLVTPPRRPSVESVESEHEHTSGLVTPPRRPSVESEESEHEHTSGLATPPFRPSVESVESEHEHTSGLATPPRRPSVESEESEHEHTSGLVTPPRRPSEESVEHALEQNTCGATPPYRLSDELVEHEYEQNTGAATPPRRSSVDSVKSEHEQNTDLATPPHRSSTGTVESDHDENSGFPTSPFRSSVQSEESEHERTHGLTTPPRCQSVESAESDYKQTSGFATPPRRQSIESVESKHDQDIGFVTPPRRLSVESEESEHEHTSGLATPPRRQSVESVESEHEHTNGLASSSRGLSAESESDREQQTGCVTPPFRRSMESEHLQTNGLVTTPRDQSVESAESEHGHESDSDSDSDRLSCSSSEDSVEHERDSDVENAVHRSSEKSVGNEHESDYEDATSTYRLSAKQEGDLDPVESAYRLSNGIELEDAVAVSKRRSNEPVVPGNSISDFHPHSSQLVPGEGGLAVDEFFADSSWLVSDGKLSQVDENDDEDSRSPCDASELYQKHLHMAPSINEECNPATAPISNSTSGDDMSDYVASPRESCMSAIDEELMNRPTIELFDMIRANRPMCDSDGSRSLDVMYDLEASHLRRMEELNRIAIDHLGNRISNLGDDMLGSAFQPGRSLHPGFRNEEKDMQWRSSDVMEEVHSKHQVDMERLRRRIRQLEEECRESIASVLTAEEMDLSEFDDDDSEPANKGFIGRQSFNPQTSFMARSDLSSSTISEHGGMDMPPQNDEPLPARILFEQIAQLTRLQRQMAEAEGDDDEEEYRERIKEQYRVLQSIKANSHQERESMSHERESVSEDEENWI